MNTRRTVIVLIWVGWLGMLALFLARPELLLRLTNPHCRGDTACDFAIDVETSSPGMKGQIALALIALVVVGLTPPTIVTWLVFRLGRDRRAEPVTENQTE